MFWLQWFFELFKLSFALVNSDPPDPKTRSLPAPWKLSSNNPGVPQVDTVLFGRLAFCGNSYKPFSIQKVFPKLYGKSQKKHEKSHKKPITCQHCKQTKNTSSNHPPPPSGSTILHLETRGICPDNLTVPCPRPRDVLKVMSGSGSVRLRVVDSSFLWRSTWTSTGRNMSIFNGRFSTLQRAKKRLD